jgi:hypothetical protein
MLSNNLNMEGNMTEAIQARNSRINQLISDQRKDMEDLDISESSSGEDEPQ